MSLNTLVRDSLESRALARLGIRPRERAHPALKLFLFILLTFLIFSKLGILLHFALFLFTLLVLLLSGCLKNLYKKLLALYVGVFLFLFFINWIFNKNPGFWDKSYLSSQYSDFVTKIGNMFSKPLFLSQASTNGSGGSGGGNGSQQEIQVGLFLGGEVMKGCNKQNGSCSCAQGCKEIACAETLAQLKQLCTCNGQGGTSCCSNGTGTCTAHDASKINKLKAFMVSTNTGKKFVGFFPKWYTITLLQFILAFNMANKLVMIISLSRALSHTTDLSSFTFAVGCFIRPLSFFKIPVKEITLIISLAIRFIPSLLSETMRIVKAQSSRGIDFKNGRLKDKATAFLSLFIPLFIISMNKSKELSNAMLSRAYLPKADRTSFKFYSLRKSHLAIFGCTLLFVIFCYYFVVSSYYFSPFGMIDPLLLVVI